MNLPEIKYETHFNPHSTSVANVGLQMISSLYAVANFFNLDKAMMWITLCFLCCCCWRYVMEMDTCVCVTNALTVELENLMMNFGRFKWTQI